MSRVEITSGPYQGQTGVITNETQEFFWITLSDDRLVHVRKNKCKKAEVNSSFNTLKELFTGSGITDEMIITTLAECNGDEQIAINMLLTEPAKAQIENFPQPPLGQQLCLHDMSHDLAVQLQSEYQPPNNRRRRVFSVSSSDEEDNNVVCVDVVRPYPHPRGTDILNQWSQQNHSNLNSATKEKIVHGNSPAHKNPREIKNNQNSIRENRNAIIDTQQQQQQEKSQIETEIEKKELERLSEEVARQLQKELNVETEERDRQIAVNIQRNLQRMAATSPTLPHYSASLPRSGVARDYRNQRPQPYHRAPSYFTQNVSDSDSLDSPPDSPQRQDQVDQPNELPSSDYISSILQRNLVRRRRSDPPDMSYEQLSQLQDVKVGLTPHKINQFPEFSYKPTDKLDPCTICLMEFQEGDLAKRLSCFHTFHKMCVTPWLKENKTCPFCKFNLS